jgi:hypothetical protein
MTSSNVCRSWLAPWSRVKKFPAFNGTRKFITVCTTASHLSVSWSRSAQPRTLSTDFLRSILILFSDLHLDLPSGLFPSGFRTRSMYTPSFPMRATCLVHLSLLDLIIRLIFCWAHEALSHAMSSAPSSETPSSYISPSVWETKFHTHTKQKNKIIILYLILYIFRAINAYSRIYFHVFRTNSNIKITPTCFGHNIWPSSGST